MCTLIFVILNPPNPLLIAKVLNILTSFYYYNVAFPYYGNQLISTVGECVRLLLHIQAVLFRISFQSDYISYSLYDVNYQLLVIMRISQKAGPLY